MNRSGRFAAACLLTLAAVGGVARAADRVKPELLPVPRKMTADEKSETARLRGEAERIRGFKLDYDPPWCKRTRPEIYRHFTRRMEAAGVKRELRLATALYAAFGFWKPDFDLAGVRLRAQSGAVGAFYAPEERRFTLVPSAKRASSSQVRIDKEAQTVHEYVHAIQDQHLGLTRIGMFSGNDRASAARALVEGDAVLAMSIYAVGRRYGRAKEGRLRLVTGETAHRRSRMRAMLKLPAFRKIPRVISVKMVFPYTGGSLFVERAFKRHGWAGVNRIYRCPPVSTEQIIHPEKYFTPRGRPIEDPVKIVLPPPERTGIAGLKRVAEDSLGELDILLLLSSYVGNARARLAAAGWGGDRYVAYERTGGARAGELVICWLSVWDREQDAREFFNAYAKTLDGKTGVKRKVLDEDGRLLDWRGAGAKSSARLERWGGAVLSVEGEDAGGSSRLADLMWTARRLKPPPRFRVGEGRDE